MATAIDPNAIPGKDIDPETIEAQAALIASAASTVRDDGSAVHTKWQGMAGVYSAPESDTLLGLMQPVSSQATAVGDNLDVVSAALTQFAAEVRPIKDALDALRLRAEAFGRDIAGGVSVRELNPAWVNTQGYQGSWNAYGAYSSPSTGGSATATADVPQYRNVTKEWHEVQEYVDRNNELISAVNAQQLLLWDAERSCANKIRALYGADGLRGFQSENDALGYGLTEIPEGTEMPWGAPVERTEGCGEATANFVFKDFLWEGILVGGVWGTVEGIGSLLVGYNPENGQFFQGDTWGAAWTGLGTLAAGLVIAATPPLNLMFAADDAAGLFGGGFLPDEVRDFKNTTDDAWLNTGKALIAWDKWEEDPGTALGESVFNVATILIPAGAAVTGVKTAGTAANVLSKMARVVDLFDPSAWAVNGALKLANGGFHGLGSLDELIGRVDGLEDPNIEVYTSMDSASAMNLLDDLDVDPNTVTARIDANGNNVLEFPGGKIEMAEGTFQNAADGVRAGDGNATATAPIREPELVTAGGVRGETGPGAVNSIVDDAPIRTETGDSGETTVIRDGETNGSGSGSGGSVATGSGGNSSGFDSDASTDTPGTGSSAALPDRVYSMMDGHDHAATFAPEQLGSSRITDSLLQNHGVSRTQFIDLINRPIDTLTPAERGMVNDVRDSLTAQITPDTVFQKVMDQPHFVAQPDGSVTLQLGQGDQMVLGNNAVVRGSISVAEDTAHLASPTDFFDRLRLDYPNTNFSSGDTSAFVLRFQADPIAAQGTISPQLHSSMGGSGAVDDYLPPFTGNGFLGTADDILPEYRADNVRMREGAELWEVLDDGTQRLFASLRNEEWIPQGN